MLHEKKLYSDLPLAFILYINKRALTSDYCNCRKCRFVIFALNKSFRLFNYIQIYINKSDLPKKLLQQFMVTFYFFLHIYDINFDQHLFYL